MSGTGYNYAVKQRMVRLVLGKPEWAGEARGTTGQHGMVQAWLCRSLALSVWSSDNKP